MGPNRILVVDYTTGILFRIDLKAALPMVGTVAVQPASRTMEKVAAGFGAADGLVRDAQGRLILTDFNGHRVFVVAKLPVPAGGKPVELTVSEIESAADLGISPDGRSLLIPDMSGGKLAILPLPR